MIVLSLFDGISTGQLALKQLGIKVDKYYASEIDKSAIEIANYHFPNMVNLGDINNWKTWDINWENIDLILNGSPCQNISFSGDKKGLDGSESSLFFVFIDILNYIKSLNPNVLFLSENVKGKKDTIDAMTSYIGVEPVRINSNLVSAQNRDRFYWTNIRNGNIEQPKDRKIFLKDIVREEDNGTNPLSLAHYNAFIRNYPNWSDSPLDGKAKPVLASYYKQPPHCPYIKDSKSESGFRRLSPLECERLQTLPDDYTKVGKMSKSARWKSIGNGWTLEVVKHILMNLE